MHTTTETHKHIYKHPNTQTRPHSHTQTDKTHSLREDARGDLMKFALDQCKSTVYNSVVLIIHDPFFGAIGMVPHNYLHIVVACTPRKGIVVGGPSYCPPVQKSPEKGLASIYT